MIIGSVFEAVMWIFIVMIFMMMWELIKMSCIDVLEVPHGKKRNNRSSWDDGEAVKCQCISCHKTVYVPMYYFNDRSGEHSGKCPHCGREMTHVRIMN